MFTETAPPAPVATAFSRKNPFPAPLRTSRRLDGPGWEKETFHYEFSLGGSGLVYEPGDSLGVFSSNDPRLVDELVHLLGFTGDEEVTALSGTSLPLRSPVLTERTITTPSRQFVQVIAERIPAAHHLLEMC